MLGVMMTSSELRIPVCFRGVFNHDEFYFRLISGKRYKKIEFACYNVNLVTSALDTMSVAAFLENLFWP
jgi:hypothetical protein